ncbi:acid-sensing ion channel 1A-like [Tachypleus tridentatus]|uniref:acid-sensing ion channel 1A-like n=1 Tax=Tachypleus tridentatus TaxID=6853 RepID=UPI003FCFE853
MMNTLKETISTSGIPGLNNICRVDSYIRKTLWLVVFLSLGTKAFLDIYGLVCDYWKYPVTVSLKMTTPDDLLFPAVTICNINPVRVDRLCEKPSDIELPQYLENALCSHKLQKEQSFVTNSTEASDNNSGSNTGIEDLQHYNEIVRQNLTTWLAELELRNRTLMQQLGHQLETFVHRCMFLHNSCKRPSDFIVKPTTTQGNCFVINSKVHQQNSFTRVSQIGPHFGLDLTLNIEPDQYLPFIEERGALILIHFSTAVGSINKDSMYLKPGESTYVGLTQINITRLPSPYPDKCRSEWPDFLEDLQMKKISYSAMECQDNCLQKDIEERCGCQVSWLPKLRTNSKVNICNEQKDTDLFNCIKNTNDMKLNCPCEPQCQEVTFLKTYSTTKWPYIMEPGKKVNQSSGDKTQKSTTTGLVRVVVYFQTLNSEEHIQEPKYTDESICSSIGGALGVYIGYSCMVVYEFIEIIFNSLKTLLLNRRIIRPTPKAFR